MLELFFNIVKSLRLACDKDDDLTREYTGLKSIFPFFFVSEVTKLQVIIGQHFATGRQ